MYIHNKEEVKPSKKDTECRPIHFKLIIAPIINGIKTTYIRIYLSIVESTKLSYSSVLDVCAAADRAIVN